MSALPRSGKIAIVTDSVAQVPSDLVRQLGIRVVPLEITIEGQKYRDGIDLEPEALYQRMRQDKDLCLTTISPSIGLFHKIFLECLSEGAKGVLYIGLTSRLSSTFNIATGAVALVREEYGERPIVLFDTRMATIAQGFLVIEAGRMADQGVSLDQILEHIQQERKRVGLVATLETLEYLARGGRIGRAAYMLGSLSHIFPIVTIDEEGVVAPVGRARGHRKCLEKMVDYTADRVGANHPLTVAVMHADTLEWAHELQQMVVDRLHPDDTFLTSFTPVMAVHTGPGLIGLAYHWHERN